MFTIIAIGLGALLVYTNNTGSSYPSADEGQTARRTRLNGINLNLHRNAEYMFQGQRDNAQLDFYKRSRSFGEITDHYNKKLIDKQNLLQNLFRRRNITMSAPTTSMHFTRPNVIVPFFDKLKHSEYRPPKIDHRL